MRLSSVSCHGTPDLIDVGVVAVERTHALVNHNVIFVNGLNKIHRVGFGSSCVPTQNTHAHQKLTQFVHDLSTADKNKMWECHLILKQRGK